MNYRDEILLKLAYELDCQAQIPGICEGGRGEPMHSNQSMHGKGASIKAHDVFIASGCRACHRAIDQGKDLTAEQRRHYWQIAHDRTLLALFERGFIRAYPIPTVRVAAPVVRIKHRPSKGRTASPLKCLPRRGTP